MIENRGRYAGRSGGQQTFGVGLVGYHKGRRGRYMAGLAGRQNGIHVAAATGYE
jgi:hypothetical protein